MGTDPQWVPALLEGWGEQKGAQCTDPGLRAGRREEPGERRCCQERAEEDGWRQKFLSESQKPLLHLCY